MQRVVPRECVESKGSPFFDTETHVTRGNLLGAQTSKSVIKPHKNIYRNVKKHKRKQAFSPRSGILGGRRFIRCCSRDVRVCAAATRAPSTSFPLAIIRLIPLEGLCASHTRVRQRLFKRVSKASGGCVAAWSCSNLFSVARNCPKLDAYLMSSANSGPAPISKSAEVL